MVDVFPIKIPEIEIFCTLALMKSTRYVQSFPNSFLIGSHLRVKNNMAHRTMEKKQNKTLVLFEKCAL
jgi:hypothetical protein